MQSLVTFLLITHVACGTVALISGLVAMVARKVKGLHTRMGLIYLYCMFYVAVSAALLFIVQPFTLFRLFLLGIAVFSFYLSFSGWRATKRRKMTDPATAFDRTVTVGTIGVSAWMVSYGGWMLLNTQHGLPLLGILFTFFGVMTGVFSIKDVAFFKSQPQKMHWFFQHITRMGGSYISAVTAFLVNNSMRLQPASAPAWMGLVVWIGPTLIGSLLIAWTVRSYLVKFKLA